MTGTSLVVINSGQINGGVSGNNVQGDAITFTGGANRLTTNTGASYTGGFTIAAGATLTLDQTLLATANSSATYSNVIAGAGGLITTSDGGRTVTLSNTNSYTGGTTINPGTLVVSTDRNFGATPTSALPNGLTFAGGTLETTASFTSARTITLNTAGTIQTDTGVITTLSGVVANGAGGAGSLTKTGLGTLALSGANTYTGGTIINAGTVQAGAAGNLGSGGITFGGNGTGTPTLATTGTFTLGQAITLNQTGTINTAANTILTTDQAITGTGGLIKTGTGTLVLSATNTYSGTTTLTGGILNVNSSAALGNGSATNTLIFNGGTLQAGGTITSPATRGVTLTANTVGTIDTNGFAVSIAGVVSGGGSLTKTGANTLTLSGANTYGGGTAINTGTLSAANPTALGTGAATVTSGATLDVNAVTVANALTLSGTGVGGIGALTGTGTAGVSGPVTLAGNAAIGGTGTLTVSGAIGESAAGFSLTKVGTGTLTLSAANTYTGPTTVQAGTLAITAGGSITSDVSNAATFTNAGTVTGNLANTAAASTATNTSAITGTVANAGTFSNTGGTVGGLLTNTAGTSTNTGTLSSGATVTGGTLALNAGSVVNGPVSNSATVTARGQINGAVTNSAGGTFTLTGALTGITTLSNDGTFTLAGNSVSIPTLTSTATSGIIQNASGTAASLTVGSANADSTYAGVLRDGAGTGRLALTKAGTGLLTLSGASTYTDGTAVNGGALNVTGSLASVVTVNNGGTLAGTAGATAGSGTIGGLTVANGGTVFPSGVTGTPGTLNVSGNVVFNANSTYRVNITPTANDRILATGTATLNGGTVQVLAGTGTYTPNLRYTLLTANGGLTGQFTSLQTTSNLAFLTPSLSYDARNVFLGFAQTAAITTVASTPNQTGPAAALNGVAPTVTTDDRGVTTVGNITPAAQVASAVINQTAPGAVQALNSLSGEVQASAISAEVQTAFLVQEAILDHLRFGEGNGVASGLGLGGSGLTGAIGSRFAPGTTLPVAYAADVPGGPVVGLVPVRPVQPGYAVWGQGFGSFGDTRGDRNAARLTRQTGGFVLGAETGFGVLSNALISDLRVGVAAGYSFTALDVSARQSTGSVESGFGAVYARGSLGAVQVRVGAAYAGNALDTRRAVLFPGFSQSVSGKTGGETMQGFGEVGYRIGFASGYVEPFAGGAAIHIGQEGFAERGGSSALTVFGRSYDVETATAGLQGQAVLSLLFGTATPIIARGLIGYRRAFGDVVPQALLAFGGGGQAFLTSGTPIARDAIVASAGLDVQVAMNTTLGLNYTGQVGERAQDHAVKGSFSYRW